MVARKHQEEPPKQPSRRAPAVPVRSQPPQSDTADGEWEEDHRGEGPVQAAVHEEVRERLEDQLEVRTLLSKSFSPIMSI